MSIFGESETTEGEEVPAPEETEETEGEEGAEEVQEQEESVELVPESGVPTSETVYEVPADFDPATSAIPGNFNVDKFEEAEAAEEAVEEEDGEEEEAPA